jgi:O-antigen/teichoic acid export membrane protein
MSIKKLFFRDTIIYGLSSYLGIIAGLILTPVYTRYFSKVEYGEMDLLNTWNNFIMLIIPLGITTSILRNFNQFEKDESEKRDNLGTLFLFLIISSSCYILLHLLATLYLILYILKERLVLT